MQNLLLTIPLGIVLILLVFMLLRRIGSLSILQVALLTSVLTMLIVSFAGGVNWPGLDVFAIHIAIFLLTIYIAAMLAKQKQQDVAGGTSSRHWAPVAIVGFFVVVILVNTIFVVLADYGTDSVIGRWFLPKQRGGAEIHSVFTGNVSHDFREKEQQFNNYQALREIQQQRGWQVDYGWRDLPSAGTAAVLLLTVMNKHGKPVIADEVTGMFYFPGDGRLDRSFKMHAVGDGKYQAEVVMMHAGRWDMVLHIQRGKDQHEIRATTDVAKPKG